MSEPQTDAMQGQMMMDPDPADLDARLAGINTTYHEAMQLAIRAKWGFSGNNDCPYEYDQGDRLVIEYDTLYDLASIAIVALKAAQARGPHPSEESP